MDVVRNWQAARAEDPEHAPRFDAFFGTSKWRQTIDNVSAYQRESDSLMAFYTERLQAIGYLTSILPLTMKNNQGGTLYRPIFASRHEKGIEFWAAISGKDPSGQRRFW